MLSMQEKSNSIEVMKIQLNAMNHRDKMTRFERDKLKEIEKANLMLRINMAENQQEIDQKNLDMTPLEERYEQLSTAK